MQRENEVQQVFLVGAKSLGAYGGYETFVYKLTEYHQNMFAFCYTQLYDVEQELNGLYTYERKPKFDMDVIKAINARKAAIED